MKLSRRAGATSQILQVFMQDSSSTTGAGLTGLVFNTSGLTAYYHRDTDTTATAISLVTMTAGTFTSSGFKEIDSTNMPGFYQFCPPNTALASGAASVAFHLKGAANMAPLPIELDLDSQVDVYLVAGTAQTARDIGASVLLSPGTGTGQISLTSGAVLLQATQTGVTIPTVTTVTNQLTAASIATGVWQDTTAGDFSTASSIGKGLYTSGAVPGGAGGLFIAGSNAATTVNFTGSLSGSVGSVTGAAGSVTGAVGSVTGNVGGNVTGSVGSVAGNVSGSVASVVGSVGGSVTGSVGSVVGAVGSVTARVTANTDQLAGQAVTAASGVTFPSSVASPTNITAGTIATVTNLTNAPTSGDFTTAMKTSLNAATPASIVGAVGSVTGAVGSVTGAVGSVTGNVGGSVASVTAAVTVGTIQAAASNIKKNTTFDLSFPMTDSTTHALKTGLTVAAKRSIDGASFGACANAVTETGSGVYNISLVGADTNGNAIMYLFTATGADDRVMEIITQP